VRGAKPDEGSGFAFCLPLSSRYLNVWLNVWSNSNVRVLVGPQYKNLPTQ
jgi:hypothetical protein